MSPSQRTEYEHPSWGWDASNANVDRHIQELVSAIQKWDTRDRERHHSSYVAASAICNIARALSADCAQLASLALIVERCGR